MGRSTHPHRRTARTWKAAKPSYATYLDEREENVKWQTEENKLYFEFYQGSKRVTGFADTEQLRATASIAKLDHNNADLYYGGSPPSTMR